MKNCTECYDWLTKSQNLDKCLRCSTEEIESDEKNLTDDEFFKKYGMGKTALMQLRRKD